MNASALVALLCAVGATGQSAPDQRPASTSKAPAARPAAATVPTAAAPAAGAVAHGAGRSQQLALDAVQLLADSLAPKADDELIGDPMSLTQALGSAIDPRSRPAVIRAYWNLAAATADYHNRRTEAHFLAQLQAERGDLAPPNEPAGAEHYQEAAPPTDQADPSAESGAPAADSTDVGDVSPEGAPLQDGPPVADDPAAATEGEPRFSAPSGEAEAAGRHEWKYRAAPANSALDDPDRAQLAAALSTSRARIQEALVAAVEAQHQLAQLVRGNRPALASDAPHVGPYRTEFRAVFAGRAAPSEAWRLDRTLPLRQRELLTRTAAVIACEDALDARLDAYRRGECPLAEVLEALDLLVAERQGFVAAVRRYNDDIGDYATLIAPAGASEVSLAALLIKPRTARITPGHTAPARAPAGAATPAEVAVPEARPGALGDDGVGAASFNAPSQRRGAAPSRPHAEPDASAAASAPAAAGEASRQPNRSGSNARRGGSSAAPPTTSPPAKTSDVPSTDELQFDGPPDVSIEPAPPTETQPDNSHSTYRAATGASAASARRAAPAEIAAVLSNTRLYGDVTSEPPHRQAQQLVARLAASADRAIERIEGSESPSVAPLTIEQCLTAASAARSGANPSLTQRRRSAVVNYWNCRQQASCVGVCVERSQLLAALGSLVLSRRGATEGAADALCWRAHSLAAQAQCEQVVTELFVAEWRLNLELSQPLDRPWYLAGTPPHAGRYRTKLDELAPVLAESTAVRQRAAMISQSYGAVTARAAEVVEVDGLRSDLLAQYAAGRSSLTEVLRLLERQCRDSQAFLTDLTRYNLAIADYALSVVPTDLPVATLAGALVMQRDAPAGG
ncbi:MAG: hypothetical protein K2Y37_13595 [Pirellulales bacterium]|nr:hypothetical protein [Pirellulales bacterium]